jgi:hypothetical protein
MRDDNHFYAQIKGMHDFRRMVLNSEYAMEPMVAVHESIHDEILFTTPDGLALTSITLLFRSQRQDIALGLFLEKLISSSREAHECFATYLGIKALPAHLGSAAIDTLDEQYANWYHRLTFLDGHFGSMHYQYIIAKSMAEVTFSSPYLCRLLDAGFSPVEPTSLETPDARLQQIIAAVLRDPAELKHVVEEKVREKWNSEGHSLWDLEFDTQWVENANVGLATEAAIADAAIPWLIEMTGLPTLDNAAVDKSMLLAWKGLEERNIIKLADSAQNPIRSLRTYELRRTRALCDTVFRNLNAREIELGDAHDIRRSGLACAEFAFIASAPDDHLTEGVVFLWRDPRQATLEYEVAAKLSTDDAWSVISAYRQQLASGKSVPRLRCIVGVVSHPDALLEPLLPILSLENGSPENCLLANGGIGLCWYACCNWIDLLEYCDHIGGGRIGTLTSDVLDFAVPYEERHPADKRLQLLVVDAVPGIIVKCTSYLASSAINNYANELTARGRVREMTRSDFDRHADVARNAYKLIRHTWRQY